MRQMATCGKDEGTDAAQGHPAFVQRSFFEKHPSLRLITLFQRIAGANSGAAQERNICGYWPWTLAGNAGREWLGRRCFSRKQGGFLMKIV